MGTKLMVDCWPRMHKSLDLCNPSTIKEGEGDPQESRNALPPTHIAWALWDAVRMFSGAAHFNS